jgi:hypothetical protein
MVHEIDITEQQDLIFILCDKKGNEKDEWLGNATISLEKIGNSFEGPLELHFCRMLAATLHVKIERVAGVTALTGLFRRHGAMNVSVCEARLDHKTSKPEKLKPFLIIKSELNATNWRSEEKKGVNPVWTNNSGV